MDLLGNMLAHSATNLWAPRTSLYNPIPRQNSQGTVSTPNWLHRPRSKWQCCPYIRPQRLQENTCRGTYLKCEESWQQVCTFHNLFKIATHSAFKKTNIRAYSQISEKPFDLTKWKLLFSQSAQKLLRYFSAVEHVIYLQHLHSQPSQ